MVFSQITYQTILVSSICLACTSLFGIAFYVIAFLSIITSKSPRPGSLIDRNEHYFRRISIFGLSLITNSLSFADSAFISAGLNDCVCLIAWLVTAIRGSLENLSISDAWIESCAYILYAGRICKQLHFLTAIFDRFLSIRALESEESSSSSAAYPTTYTSQIAQRIKMVFFAGILSTVWIAALASSTPILRPSVVLYEPHRFRFLLEDHQTRIYFDVIDRILFWFLLLATMVIYVWIVHRYMSKYRKQNSASAAAADAAAVTSSNLGQRETTEKRELISKELRQSVTMFLLITVYLGSTLISWRIVKDSDNNNNDNDDDYYLLYFIFTVYIWCFNHALPPSIFLVVEKTLQRYLAKAFEKRYGRRVNTTANIGASTSTIRTDADNMPGTSSGITDNDSDVFDQDGSDIGRGEVYAVSYF